MQCLGWLCDGLVHDPGVFMYFDTEKPKEFADRVPFAAVRTAAFRRNGVPVLAVWQPQHVELNERPLRGRLEFVIGENAGALAHPVLIDPVRCEVYDVAALVNGADRAKQNRRGIECAAPFFALDYPVLLTGASIFDK